MRRSCLSVIIFHLLFVFSQSSAAQTDSLRQTMMNPIVITGTGTYHRAENAPVVVKVITAKELQDAQASSLQDALSRLTSTITTQTNGMGTFVNFNGVSDDYIVILENGKRISGDDRWNRISLDNVKRIEIFSGAASALYGSDAIAGVINIITEDSKAPVAASSATKVMNNGRMDQDINVDVNAGSVSSQTSYTYHQADNWQVNHYQEFDEDGTKVLKLTGRPMSAGFQSQHISEKLEWRIDDQWSAYVRGSYYDYTTDRPQTASYFTSKKQTDGTYKYTAKQAYTYDLHHRSYTYGGGTRWSPNSRTFLYLDVYSDNFESKYDYWQTDAKEGYEETRKRTHYVNETLRGIFRLADWNKLSAGTELVQESLNSESDNIDFETTNSYNLFAQDELKIVQGLEAVVGARLTLNDHFGTAFTPNAGLFFHVGDFRLRGSYAGGYRTPTLSQLYATDQAKTTSRYTLHNKDLKPERNHFFNLNAEYGNAWMSVSVSGFMNKIRDMINYRTMTTAEIDNDAALKSLRDDDGWKTIRRRDNIDRATLRGVSASVKFLLPYGFTLGGGYTFTDSEAETQTLNTKTQQYEVTKTPVDKSVKHVASMMASWDKSWRNYHLNITLNGHLQGERYSSTYGYADGYGQWDLTTRHSIKMRHYTLEPGLGVENIFNQRDNAYWNSNFSTTTPGRSFIASLRMKY
ncbi:MAG: TonB-dependent receptor [Bacteroidaceae bacterium]|nr:TonB-dependent receptor [Bacteroidaceae bacterium]